VSNLLLILYFNKVGEIIEGIGRVQNQLDINLEYLLTILSNSYFLWWWQYFQYFLNCIISYVIFPLLSFLLQGLSILSSSETLYNAVFRQDEVDDDEYKLFGLHPSVWIPTSGLILEDIPQLSIQVFFAISSGRALSIIQICSFIFTGWHICFVLKSRWHKRDEVDTKKRNAPVEFALGGVDIFLATIDNSFDLIIAAPLILFSCFCQRKQNAPAVAEPFPDVGDNDHFHFVG
jgi:hypothetical protein